jgi:hypothetical protein
MKIPARNSNLLGLINVLFRMVTIAVIAGVGMTGQVSAQEQPVPPPSAPAQLSQADLEKLAGPIALYPDPLLAVMLPASVYPLEIVQAARFVQDTNNLSRLDDQPWDANVKAVARFPAVIQKMNDDLQWTIQLGNAFVDQSAGLMNAIQTLRAKAHAAGTLKSSKEQVVTITNGVVERTYQDQIIYVTNTVIEIQPTNSEVVYVPVYNPAYVYYPPPGYVYYPIYVPIYWYPHVTPYRCNWWYGGIYVGGGGMVIWGGSGPYHPPYYPCPPGYYRPPAYYPPPGYRPPAAGTRPPGFPPPGPAQPIQRPSGPGTPTTLPANNTRWQPDPTRRQTGGTGGLANTGQARGWGSATPSTGAVGSRPNTGTTLPGYNPAGTPVNNRPAQPTTSQNSAFNGVGNGNAARNSSYRGAASRGFGGGGFRGGGRR